MEAACGVEVKEAEDGTRVEGGPSKEEPSTAWNLSRISVLTPPIVISPPVIVNEKKWGAEVIFREYANKYVATPPIHESLISFIAAG